LAFAVQLYTKDGPLLYLPRRVMSARMYGEARRLEGSVFAHPIIGRDAIGSILRLSACLYRHLEFTHELASPDRTYLRPGSVGVAARTPAVSTGAKTSILTRGDVI
jgi:hypothetical protein